ncbi:sulfotransferase [Oscillatoria sp. CS-180]|uniref:sulfotransferase family protein n=1 Tax=Oscillatoria sp. CS-180 TaxID=3021720 RepID=UPI002330AB32|nr:sulfotransferase [Oscillatoria sp. CS-180]MDB9526430.1 sulfotransferase [Oscillatoria sp. CS-180]
MVLPNFLIIGAQKAGTTALARHMSRHPQIFVSEIKEPGFFDFEGESPKFAGPRDLELYSHIITDFKAYQQLFSNVSDEVAIGEATTWYLYSTKAPERIYHYLPNVKLIVILRDPVERAYSAFMHAIRDERETISDFELALQREEERCANNWEYLWRYTQMGFYSVQLERYFNLFGQDQIRIYLYEDLKNETSKLLSNICEFLEVDDSIVTTSIGRRNVSGTPKNKLIHDFLSKPNLIKKSLRPLLSEKLRSQVKISLNNRNRVKEEMPQRARVSLRKLYREDILKLQDMLNRDLSNWLI